MIQQLSSKLLKQLEQELEQIASQSKDPLEKLTSALRPIRQALQRLKHYLNENPFDSKEEEIRFFKYIKPDFYCWQIYYTELYTIEAGKPHGNAIKQTAYLEQELRYIERFFQQYQFHYQYYRLNADELDSLYFVRGVEVQSVLLPNLPDVDPSFSTSSDYLFSKIKAFELLQEHIQNEIRELDPQSYPPKNPQDLNNTGSLTWTGDKTNLVEVIYGLFYTGQLNNGNASVADIIKWMEQHLHIDLHRAYRNFLDIRTRKRDSHTRYLDKMRASIQQRVDEDNEYKPNRGIKLRKNPGDRPDSEVK